MSLVQKMERFDKEDKSAKGVDKFFRFSYMGATEFECGILFASLKVFRTQSNMVIPINFERDNGEYIRMWYVGPSENFDDAVNLIDSEVNGRVTVRLKEPTLLRASLAGESWARESGWWWLSQDGWPNAKRASKPTWAIFKHEDDAERWLDCIELQGS